MTEYLFSGERRWSVTGGGVALKRYRILKRTAKRVFYVRGGEDIDERGDLIDYGNISSTADTDGDVASVDRVELEANGHLYSSHAHCQDWHLFVSLEGLLAYLGEET